METETQAWDEVLDALVRQGWFIGEGRWPEAAVTQARGACEAMLAEGRFHPAVIGRGNTAQRNESIRGDRICWLERDVAPPPLADYLDALESLRATLNRELMLGLAGFECMAACYAPGSRYGRHLDRFRDDDTRTVTAILYLNDDWQPGNGGELRIHFADGSHRDVPPRAGTLVVFMTDGLEHEVLTTQCQRMTLTTWFRRRVSQPV